MWTGLFVVIFVVACFALAIMTVCYFGAVAQSQRYLKQLHNEANAHANTARQLREACHRLAKLNDSFLRQDLDPAQPVTK